MIKRSSSRNNRSRGIKVKHVLQIVLLIGICFWLIYQVKRSHDKKKEFGESGGKVLVGTQTAFQIPKLGRKDLNKNGVDQNVKHEEEEDDENIVEDEDKHEHKERQEENGHGTKVKQDDNSRARGGGDEDKSEAMEEERRVDDDEMDENVPEKPEVDVDRDEEFVDKEKEEDGDEKENENREDLVESHNIHEAREQQYKGDDASSAVTHDTHTTSTETLTVGTYSNETSDNEVGNNSLSNPVDGSHRSSIEFKDSESYPEETISNLTIAVPIPESNNNMTKSDISSEHDKMVIFSHLHQNDTLNSTVAGDVKDVRTGGLEQGGNNVSGSYLTVAVKTENGAAAGDESSNLEGGDIEKTRRFVASNQSESKVNTEMNETNMTQNISYGKDNTNVAEDEEFKDDKQPGNTSNSSSTNGTSDLVQHHVTDSYNSHILDGVSEVRADHDTLQVIRNVGNNDGNTTSTD